MQRHPSWGFTDPNTGAQEAIIRVHDIQEAAESAGLPGAYDYGCQRCCWMGHLLTNWAGDDGFVKKMYVELRRFNVVGDTTWCKGTVTGKREENGERVGGPGNLGREPAPAGNHQGHGNHPAAFEGGGVVGGREDSPNPKVGRL